MNIPHTTPAAWGEISPQRFAATLCTDTPENCAIALLGLPDDTGVQLNGGRVGAAGGPAAFRSALARLGAADPAGAPWPGVFDAGDVIPAGSLAETHQRVTSAVDALIKAGMVPIGIGGGHDLTFPLVRAVARHFSPLSGVYFDAHLDVRETAGSGMSFRRIVEDCGVRELHLHGFKSHVNAREHHAWFLAHGGRIHEASGMPTLPGAAQNLFVSFDLDVIDMAFAPGVSAPNPAGWTSREAEHWVHACGADSRVRCFDLMELCPAHDEGGRTARLAAHLFLSFLAGFASRR
jgi:formimidoylglutamase